MGVRVAIGAHNHVLDKHVPSEEETSSHKSVIIDMRREMFRRRKWRRGAAHLGEHYIKVVQSKVFHISTTELKETEIRG